MSLLNEQGYLNYDHIFSYNQPLRENGNYLGMLFRHIFIVGDRGVGKTYGLTDWLIDTCYKNKKKFIWVRNTDAVLEELTKFNGRGFLADHPKKLNMDDSLFTLTKGNLIYGEQLLGTFTSLGGFFKLKGVNFDDYEYFIFDEFMPEKRETIRVDYDYALKSLVQSIFRKRTNFLCFYLANVLKTSSNILEFFKFSIQPHFKDQVIQKNKQKNAIMFYLQNKHNDKGSKREGDAFATANVYTESNIITDYKKNIDPNCGTNLKKKEIISYIATDTAYFVLREYKDKVAVIKVKKPSDNNTLPIYALNKKHVFGDVTYSLKFKNHILKMWNTGGFIFRNEYTITQFTESLFMQ